MIPYRVSLLHSLSAGSHVAPAPGPAPPLPAARSNPTPMALSAADIERLALLARIEIDAAEVDVVCVKLDAILGMIGELAAVDTTGVLPMAHALDVAAPLREDVVTETDAHALFQRVAPAVEDGLYLVPRVIE